MSGDKVWVLAIGPGTFPKALDRDVAQVEVE
jgi:hypothetical protein